jgi:uncharacterized membrane protein YgcG
MPTYARDRHTTTKLFVAAAVAMFALLAAGVQTAAAARAATGTATSKCWLDVVNDWLDNNQVDHLYPIPCYTQAIQHLNLYPDVQNYSSAIDDIHRALLAAIRQQRGEGPSILTGGPGTDHGSAGGTGGGGGSGGGPPKSGGIFRSLGDKLGPGNAQSVPLPLLVLGGLAVLLLLAAAGTWLAKRLQARRVMPRTAPAPAGRQRR